MAGIAYSVRASSSCHVCCKPQVPHPTLLRRHLSAVLRLFLSAVEAQTEHVSSVPAAEAARQPFYTPRAPRGAPKDPAAQAVIQLSHYLAFNPELIMPAIIDKIAGALHLQKQKDTEPKDTPKTPVFDKEKVTVLFVLGGPGVGACINLATHPKISGDTLSTTRQRDSVREPRQRFRLLPSVGCVTYVSLSAWTDLMAAPFQREIFCGLNRTGQIRNMER